MSNQLPSTAPLGSRADCRDQEIWDDYFQRLKAWATGRLQPRIQRVFGAEDLAVEALNKFLKAEKRGQTPPLDRPDEVWRFLLRVAKNTLLNCVDAELCEKRGGGKVRGESIFLGASGINSSSEQGFDNFAAAEPGQRDRVAQLIEALPDRALQSVAQLKLEGFTNQEIAERMNLSCRSIERKLGLIRELWLVE